MNIKKITHLAMLFRLRDRKAVHTLLTLSPFRTLIRLFVKTIVFSSTYRYCLFLVGSRKLYRLLLPNVANICMKIVYVRFVPLISIFGVNELSFVYTVDVTLRPQLETMANSFQGFKWKRNVSTLCKFRYYTYAY